MMQEPDEDQATQQQRDWDVEREIEKMRTTHYECNIDITDDNEPYCTDHEVIV